MHISIKILNFAYKLLKNMKELSKGAQKKALKRYEDNAYKELKDYELYADQDFIYYSDFGFDTVIKIKVNGRFFDPEHKIIRFLIDILDDYCGLGIQYIGLGKDIVLAADEYGTCCSLYPQSCYNDRQRNLRRRLGKELHIDLVFGCFLIEKFVNTINPKKTVEARLTGRNSIKGRFVLEMPTFYSLINPKLCLKDENDEIPVDIEKRIDDFIDLILSKDSVKERQTEALRLKQKMLYYCFNLTWHYEGETEEADTKEMHNFSDLTDVPMTVEMKSEYVDLMIQKNIPDSTHVDIVKDFAKALLTGAYNELENMVADNAETNVYRKRTVYGKSNVMEYWKEWEAKYIKTRKVKSLEILFSNYNSDVCILINKNNIILFYIQDDKISKLDLDFRIVTDNENTDCDLLDLPMRRPSNDIEFSHDEFVAYLENRSVFSKTGKNYHSMISCYVKGDAEDNAIDILSQLDKITLSEELLKVHRQTATCHIEKVLGVYDKSGLRLSWKKSLNADDIMELVRIEELELGAWQLYLLKTVKLLTENGYPQRKYIFDKYDLSSIKAFENYDLNNLSNQPFIFPSVSISRTDGGNTTAHVYCCYWNDNCGLIREHIKITLLNGHVEKFEDEGCFVIYNYHSGIF